MRSLRYLALLLLVACASVSRHDEATLRVLVFNIHAGRDAAGNDNLQRVADLVRDTNADLVLLQEVDRGTKRSGGVDQLGELMRLTGLRGEFGKSLDYQGGEYGIAILSRWQSNAREVVPLRVTPPQTRAGGSLEPRVALRVETNGVQVVNTHLDASREDTYRLQEAATLARIITENAGAPTILGGDLNATPESPVHEPLRNGGLRDSWTECGSGDALTFPAGTPIKRIDYLWLSEHFRCTEARVLASEASDHRPLLVTVKRSAARAAPPRR